MVERIEFDLLFRWFVGLGVDDPVWDATAFARNNSASAPSTASVYPDSNHVIVLSEQFYCAAIGKVSWDIIITGCKRMATLTNTLGIK